MRLVRRLFKKEAPYPGLQGEEYEALKMTRRAQKKRRTVGENFIADVNDSLAGVAATRTSDGGSDPPQAQRR